jgi:DNA-binding NtrC family response regulator
MSNLKTTPQPPLEPPKVIVLEDDFTTSQLLCLTLKKAGFNPLACYGVREANELLTQEVRLSAMIIDLSLPDGDGIEVMRNGRRIHKDLPCFVLTAKEAVESAVQAMKAGAENYLLKPFEPETLVNALKAAIRIYHGQGSGWSEDFIPPQGIRRWKSAKMAKALEIAKQASKTLSSVMITGEPYTGKNRFAQLIRESSKLALKRFTTTNLAALSPPQIETELFGAPLDKLVNTSPFGRGKLARCRGETLYIENIDCLHPAAQAHLLDFINDEVASPSSKLPPCRLITSSSVDLKKAIKENRFRQDLWYALAVYQIEVPSLAERLDDLPLLCENIITRICVTRKLRRPSLTRRALEMLLDHPWPGNLSELYSCLEHAITRTTDGLIGPDDFPTMRRHLENDTRATLPFGASSIVDITRLTLVAALETCGGNRRRAAQRLKISLRTIYNMIERYDLPRKTRRNIEISEADKDIEIAEADAPDLG